MTCLRWGISKCVGVFELSHQGALGSLCKACYAVELSLSTPSLSPPGTGSPAYPRTTSPAPAGMVDRQTTDKARQLLQTFEEDTRAQLPHTALPSSNGFPGSAGPCPPMGAQAVCPSTVMPADQDKAAEAAASSVRPFLAAGHSAAMQKRMLQKLGAQACAALLRGEEGSLPLASRALAMQHYKRLMNKAMLL
eukprot:jgi/Tetstr1/423675/TSEL_014309.t1